MKKSARASDRDGGDSKVASKGAVTKRGRTGSGLSKVASKAAVTKHGRTASRLPQVATTGAVTKSGRIAKRDAGTAAKRPALHDSRKFARVFMSGRSQAVRLPKEFRFDTDRVMISRVGCELVLTPVFKDWEDYWKNSTRLPDDFESIIEEMRRDELPLDEREPFD